MLSKCCNPKCTAAFLYLHSGQLFRIETAEHSSPADSEDDFVSKDHGRRLEYFWLCAECAPVMTLSYEKGVGVVAKRIARRKAAAANSVR